MDRASRGRRIVPLAAVVVAPLVLRRQQLRWGATAAELVVALPGDERLPAADLVATRAISIQAPVDQVWPWVAQLGQGRGGFYSYDRLENLAGCDVHSADRIVPDWQHVAVGDPFRLHPEVALQVAVVDPPHALVLEGVAPAAGSAAEGPTPPYDFTWAFVLARAGSSGTRLLVRERYGYRTGWAPLLVEPLSLVSFVMTQRMLRGIRDRAEGASEAATG